MEGFSSVAAIAPANASIYKVQIRLVHCVKRAAVADRLLSCFSFRLEGDMSPRSCEQLTGRKCNNKTYFPLNVQIQ